MLAKLARDLASKVIRRSRPDVPDRAHRADPAFLACVALKDAGRVDEARVCYERLLERDAGNAIACNNLGIIHHQQDAPAKAVAMFHRAIRSDPQLAEPHANLGNVLQDQCDLEGALAQYDAAILLQPALVSARYSRAATLLALGRFEEGWVEYEWRAHLGGASAPRKALYPRWEGSQDLNGKRILLFAEQGFGDAIQFIRYAHLVAQRGAHVVVECQPALHSLIRTAEGVGGVIAAGEPLGVFDFEIPLLSLPLAFETSSRSIPAAVPYLKPDAYASAHWREKLSAPAYAHGLKVGLAWSGNPAHAAQHARSLPVDYLPDLTRIPGCTFFSLQKGEAAIDSATLQNRGIHLHDFTAELQDFHDTAACMSALDAVVSVDTAVAHLAGALAKPTFVALPFSADWRWLARGDTTAWYPTMRLIRQPSAGDWGAVIDTLNRALQDRSE